MWRYPREGPAWEHRESQKELGQTLFPRRRKHRDLPRSPCQTSPFWNQQAYPVRISGPPLAIRAPPCGTEAKILTSSQPRSTTRFPQKPANPSRPVSTFVKWRRPVLPRARECVHVRTCMRVSVCACMYVCEYVCVCMCVRVRTCMRVSVCSHVCVYVCMHVCVCAHLHVCAHACACIRLCVCPCVRVYVCVCMFPQAAEWSHP